MAATHDSTLKRMKLRYAGTCRSCATALGAGTTAVYDRSAKNVLCLGCAAPPVPASVEPASPDPPAGLTPPVGTAPTQSRAAWVDTPGTPVARVAAPAVVRGTAGASARREHERRKGRRKNRIRTEHPHLGGLILALSDDPQSTKAWAVGARGEELLARQLDTLAGAGVLLLHDRRIPPTRANIDHLAVTPTGVYVIDAKRYRGRPHLRVDGGLRRPRTEKLLVGSRDCTPLVAGVQHQVDLVHAELTKAGHGDVPVHAMLCFVQADWPLIGGSVTVAGVDVVWPRKAVSLLVRAGPVDVAMAGAVHRSLAGVFPVA